MKIKYNIKASTKRNKKQKIFRHSLKHYENLENNATNIPMNSNTSTGIYWNTS